jgi:hypothetical protein
MVAMTGSECATWVLESPVMLLIYNRQDLATAVLARIAAARPSRLFIVADGPRSDRPGDAERCQATRQAVFERVDWPCEVRTNVSERNLGCRDRTVTGLNWVFEQVDQAIIFDDDCLPDPTLFRFFDEMLVHYRSDDRVMMINAVNQVPGGWKAHRQQYHFSACPNLWGWASWRRAWCHYDVDMKLLAVPDVRERVRRGFGNPTVAAFWMDRFERVSRREIDTWDFQWNFACRVAGGLSVVPAVNLVTNIGCGVDATHTTRGDRLAGMPTVPMRFPIHFHDVVAVDPDYERSVPSALRARGGVPRRRRAGMMAGFRFFRRAGRS